MYRSRKIIYWLVDHTFPPEAMLERPNSNSIVIQEIIDRDEYEPSNSSQKTFIQFYLKEKEKEAKRTADIALTDSNTIVLDIAEEKGKQNKATTSTFTSNAVLSDINIGLFG